MSTGSFDEDDVRRDGRDLRLGIPSVVTGVDSKEVLRTPYETGIVSLVDLRGIVPVDSCSGGRFRVRGS